jgi:annexin A7/11
MSSLEEYATKIHDNLKSKEIDDIILDTIMKNNLRNRVGISNIYQANYGTSLFEELKSKIGGDFGYCAGQLFLTPLDFCIYHLNIGISKANECAMEQLTSRTTDELKLIEDKYNKTYGKDLKTEIIKAFSGAVGKNLLNLWNVKRVSNPNPNKKDCENYANTLIGSKPKDWVENEDIFKSIFIQRSPEELILIARYYLKNSGKNLIDDIENKTGGKNQMLLKEILYNNIMPHEIFADKIKKAVKGLGTDEEMLSRALVSRCELDMGAIRDMYMTKYKVTLKEDIVDDTSGSYQKICVYLCEK